MIILGLDPGATTGWAVLKVEERKLIPLNFGETRDQTLVEIKHLFDECDLVVYETFNIRPEYARKGKFNWNAMPAPQAIGSLQTLAALAQKKVVGQSPSLKPPGYAIIGQTYKKGKAGMHSTDAMAHAAYYAVKHLNALPAKRV